MEEGSKIRDRPAEMEELLLQLHRMRRTESEFMAVTRSILKLETEEGLSKNNQVCSYLAELGLLPRIIA
jgi:hypothetical protein